MKGGGTGGGRSQLVPADRINLHFTGDLHAVTSANNLLSAMLDNQLYFENPLGIDPRRVLCRRVMDMNDRALRHVIIGLGGRLQGVPREGIGGTLDSPLPTAVRANPTGHRENTDRRHSKVRRSRRGFYEARGTQPAGH